MWKLNSEAHGYWLEHVRRWKASGLPRGKYAAKAGPNPPVLGWYAWRLKGARSKARPMMAP